MKAQAYALAAGLLCACASSPAHRPISVSVRAGAASVDGTNIEVVDIDAVKRDEIDTDTGFNAGFGVGFRPSASWEFELDVSQTEAGGEIPGFGTFEAFDADTSWTAMMVNARYRFRPDAPAGPYLGMGLGYMTGVKVNLRRASGGRQDFDGKDSGAVQLFVGGEMSLGEALAGFLELRYFRALSQQEEWILGVLSGVARSELRPESSALLFGLRYRF